MISLELREKILHYINKDITLEDLEDWLIPKLPIYIKSPDSTDSDIISALELGLAELSNGIRSEEELRTYLKECLQHVIVSLTYPSMIENLIAFGSSNQTSNLQALDFSSPNGILEYTLTRS
jgi:hypothetical protein